MNVNDLNQLINGKLQKVTLPGKLSFFKFFNVIDFNEDKNGLFKSKHIIVNIVKLFALFMKSEVTITK